MIHTAQVEITCDNHHVCGFNNSECKSVEFFELPAGARNIYICEDVAVEKFLEREGWIVRDGKHFCCEECMEDSDAS